MTGVGVARVTKEDSRLPRRSVEDCRDSSLRFGINSIAVTLDLDDASFQPYRYGVGAIVGVQFGKNTPNVSLYGLFRDGEIVGNNFVGIAGSYLPQNLDF